MIYEKIAVIDDDPRIHKTIALTFPEYQIVSFGNGREALSYLAKPHEINVVLLDVMMPGMDGLSVLEEVRKISKDTGVILMTAYGSKDILIEALRKHADDFIEKPFAPSEIKEKVYSLLGEKLYPKNLRKDKDSQVGRIKGFVERNCSNAKLEFIADRMCLSPKYVSRLFKQKSQTSFRVYKLRIKMDKAKSLLERTHLNVSEIAAQLGYQNPESFMRIFKRIIRMTPSEYRAAAEKKRTGIKKNT